MRPTELCHLLPQSTATVKRYARARQEAAWPFGPGPSTLRLTGSHRKMLTLFWVKTIARGARVGPGDAKRRFFEIFCPVCLHQPHPHPPNGSPPIREIPSRLAEAILIGLRACEVGIRPCASGASRFAILSLALGVKPWDAAVFLLTQVGPRKWWIRNCLAPRCEREIVTPSVATRRCPLHERVDE
ncbi:MAG: hypothetical protein ACE5NC_02740 [Anaerolineae bacterium]